MSAQWCMVYACKIEDVQDKDKGLVSVEHTMRTPKPVYCTVGAKVAENWAKDGWLCTVSPVEEVEFTD